MTFATTSFNSYTTSTISFDGRIKIGDFVATVTSMETYLDPLTKDTMITISMVELGMGDKIKLLKEQLHKHHEKVLIKTKTNGVRLSGVIIQSLQEEFTTGLGYEVTIHLIAREFEKVTL